MNGKQKNRGGRPPAGDQKRDRVVSIYLNNYEYQNVLDLCGHQKIQSVIRKMLIEGSVSVYKPFNPVNEELRSQLIHTLNNINQLLAHGHRIGLIDSISVMQEIETTKVLLKSVSTELRGYKNES